MMSARRIYSGYREKNAVKSGRFISDGKHSDVLRTYSRNTAIIAVDSSPGAVAKSSKSVVSYDYRTQNNYTKRGSSFDWLTDSETGTPDFQSPDSDSSTGSLLSRADAAAAKRLAEEWDKLERTLYDEEGPKVTQKHLIEECKQWRELFPHLRIVGRQLISANNGPLANESDVEVIVQHPWENKYEGDLQFPPNNNYSSSNSSRSDWSNDDDIILIADDFETGKNYQNNDSVIANKRVDYRKCTENDNITKLIDQKRLEVSLNSLLRITPLKLSNSSICDIYRSNHYSSILRSEISSSRWRRNVESPDDFYSNADANSSLPILNQNSHNSAKPILTPEKNKKNAMSSFSAGENRTGQWKRPPNTAVYKNREISKLEPLNRSLPLVENVVYNSVKSVGFRQHGDALGNRVYGKSHRKVSLPPIQANDNSCKLVSKSGVPISKTIKKSLIPLNVTASKKQEYDNDSNGSVVKVCETEYRRPRRKYGSKNSERY